MKKKTKTIENELIINQAEENPCKPSVLKWNSYRELQSLLKFYTKTKKIPKLSFVIKSSFEKKSV